MAKKLENSYLVYTIAILLSLVFISFMRNVDNDPRIKQEESLLHTTLNAAHGLYQREILKQVLTTQQNKDEGDHGSKFWTPISVKNQASKTLSGMQITFCKLNFAAHSKAPHVTPMFKDLLSKSHCDGNKVVKQYGHIANPDLYNTSLYLPAERVPIDIPVTGFIFHESRVGSTLAANLFAVDEETLVFSESAPPPAILLHCSGCPRKSIVEKFRAVVQLMCKSTYHKRCIFKMQSITVSMIDIVLDAFPNVPWIFLYRQPVETMMSHAKSDNMINANCLRSKRRGDERVSSGLTVKEVVQRILTSKEAGSNSLSVSHEAWCAAHLDMLCWFALEAEKTFGRYRDHQRSRRGFLLPYESLPGAIPKIIFPLFGINASEFTAEWSQKMQSTSMQYSKSRLSFRGNFKEDSSKKNKLASAEVKRWAEKIMLPTFYTMKDLSRRAVEDLLSTHAIWDVGTLQILQRKTFDSNLANTSWAWMAPLTVLKN